MYSVHSVCTLHLPLCTPCTLQTPSPDLPTKPGTAPVESKPARSGTEKVSLKVLTGWNILKHSETCPNPPKFMQITLNSPFTATLKASSFAMTPGPNNLWCLMYKIKHEIACKCFKQSIRGRCWLQPVLSAKWPSNACGPHSESFQHSNASPPENNGIQFWKKISKIEQTRQIMKIYENDLLIFSLFCQASKPPWFSANITAVRHRAASSVSFNSAFRDQETSIENMSSSKTNKNDNNLTNIYKNKRTKANQKPIMLVQSAAPKRVFIQTLLQSHQISCKFMHLQAVIQPMWFVLWLIEIYWNSIIAEVRGVNGRVH